MLVPVSTAVLPGEKKAVASLPEPQAHTGSVHPSAGSPVSLVSTPETPTSVTNTNDCRSTGCPKGRSTTLPKHHQIGCFIHPTNKVYWGSVFSMQSTSLIYSTEILSKKEKPFFSPSETLLIPVRGWAGPEDGLPGRKAPGNLDSHVKQGRQKAECSEKTVESWLPLF